MRNHKENRHISLLKQQLSDGKIDRREFLRSSTLLGLSAAAAYAFAGRVERHDQTGTALAAEMPKGGRIRVGNRVDAIGDPHAMVNIQSGIVARQVFDYLTDTGYDNITRPSLLEGWHPSDDLRTWTLMLRKGIKWHNGRELVADDVVWNLKHALDEKTGSSVVGLMKGYMLAEYDEGGAKHTRLWDANAVEKVDTYTVRLNCKEPQLAVPEHLFHYPFVIQDPEANGVFKVGSNATGPFELVEYEPQRRAVYKPIKNYWGEGPYVDEFQIVHLADDPSAAIAAMASNQIEGLYQASVNNVDALLKLQHLQYYEAQTATTMVARGKVNIKPFSDPKVRKALRLAVNQDEVLRVASRGGLVGEHHHVCSIHPEYAKLPMIKQDIEAAKRLLAEAGYPDGLDLEIAAPTDETWMLNGLQAMVQHWKAAGVRVKINTAPGSVFWENWLKHPFSVTNWNHRPLGIMVLGIAYRSGVPWNESDFANPEFDRLLTKAEGLVDVDKRREVMAEIEKIMQEEGPVVQPFWTSIFTFYNKKVKGFRMHPSFYVYGNRLAIEA
jgi:peptide/nickel transport system substrate-binding protein